MSKQDRQGVRTPADIERKYNLGSLGEQTGQQSEQLNKLNQTLNQFMATTNAEIERLSKNVAFPVGAIYVSTDETNPSEIFEGEWELLAEGHLLVGMDQESEEALPELLQLNDSCYLWKRTK